MALQIALDATQSGIGVAVPAAYARIVNFTWTTPGAPNAGTLVFTLEWHYDNAARQAKARPINGTTHVITNFDFPADRTLLKAIYEWCKAQPDFANSIEV